MQLVLLLELAARGSIHRLFAPLLLPNLQLQPQPLLQPLPPLLILVILGLAALTALIMLAVVIVTELNASVAIQLVLLLELVALHGAIIRMLAVPLSLQIPRQWLLPRLLLLPSPIRVILTWAAISASIIRLVVTATGPSASAEMRLDLLLELAALNGPILLLIVPLLLPRLSKFLRPALPLSSTPL